MYVSLNTLIGVAPRELSDLWRPGPWQGFFGPHYMRPDLNSLSLTIGNQGVYHIIIGVVIFIIVGVSSSIIEVRRLWAICELHFLLSYTHSQGIRELASIIHYDIGDLVYVEATTSRHREL